MKKAAAIVKERNSLGVRQICLDTETTGRSPSKNDRVIEIGAIELIDRQITDRIFHKYIDPEVDFIHPGAVEVHGLTADMLRGKPIFRDCYRELIEFIEGAELIIHNAPFDIRFLNAEFGRIKELDGNTVNSYCPVIIDTLKIAKGMRPSQSNTLDALRDHYNITDDRVKHGALVDARILAKIYLLMTVSQGGLALDFYA